MGVGLTYPLKLLGFLGVWANQAPTHILNYSLEVTTMRFEYELAKTLSTFCAGLSLSIAILTGYWLAYITTILFVVSVAVTIAVHKYNNQF